MTRISGPGGGAPGVAGLSNSGQIAQPPAPSPVAQGNAAINKPDKYGYTPLLRQLTRQDVSAANVEALLKAGANVAATIVPYQEQPVTDHFTETVNQFDADQLSSHEMAEAVQLFFQDRNAGRNALTLAIELKLSQDVIHLLIKASGPELMNACDGQDDTPLCLAAAKGDLDIVQSLIAAGADIKQQNARRQPQSPLICAVHEGRDVVVHALLSMGTNVHGFEVITQALANLALRWRDLPSGSRTRLFMQLEAAVANWKHLPAESYMFSIFEPAIDQAIAGDTSLLEALLASDGLNMHCSIFFPDKMSPLGRAISTGKVGLCRMLFESQKIDLALVIADELVVSPLQLAARTGHLAICRLVAEQPGQWRRKSILDEAVTGLIHDDKFIDVTIWCLNRRYKFDELSLPLKQRTIVCGKLFPSAWKRARTGDLEPLEGMLDTGLLRADTAAELKGNPALGIESGRNMMTYAVEHFPGLVPALLKFGFAVDLQDELGDTPLGLAVAAGDVETVRLLVNAGARVTEAIYGHFLVFEYNASSDQSARVSEIRTILEPKRIRQQN